MRGHIWMLVHVLNPTPLLTCYSLARQKLVISWWPQQGFVYLSCQGITNQLRDIFWTPTSSCLHILSTLAAHSTRHCQKCCAATGGWQSCKANIHGADYILHFQMTLYILGCGWACPKSIAVAQFFFSRITTAKQKSTSLCWFASLQLTVMLKIQYSDIITIMRLVTITYKNQRLLYIFRIFMCLLT